VIRAKDPLAIKRWLVLAPIPSDDTDGATALDREQIPNEACGWQKSHLIKGAGEGPPAAAVEATGELNWAEGTEQRRGEERTTAARFAWIDSTTRRFPFNGDSNPGRRRKRSGP